MSDVQRPPPPPRPIPSAAPALLLAVVGLVAVAVGCEAGPPPATPTPQAGTQDAPREVNLIAKDYSFLPATLGLIRGETVVIHLVNGGLEVHEAVIGDPGVQAAWETAEAATGGAPPGPTPVVSVPPDVAGLRAVVRSGERVDIRWTVPIDAGQTPEPDDWIVGCHIPGHLASGMWIPVHWITAPAS